MLLTDKKAAEVVCPVLSAGGTTSACQGSRCAAWRWDVEQVSRGRDEARISAYDDALNDDIALEDAFAARFKEAEESRLGWCGLAGRPDNAG